MAMVSTTSIRPSSAKVRTNRYFFELSISSLRAESAAEEILSLHAAWIDTGFALSAALLAMEARVRSEIEIKSPRESVDFNEAGISICVLPKEPFRTQDLPG